MAVGRNAVIKLHKSGKSNGKIPKCRRCSAGSSIWLQKAQSAEGTYRSLWRPPKPWQTADFGVWWRYFHLWMTRKCKLSDFAGLPPAGCRIFSRPRTRGSSACCRTSPGGFPCIFWALMATWLSVSSWRCRFLKSFTPISFLNTWCTVNLLTPDAVAKVQQFRRGVRSSFSRVFLRSWGEGTLRFLPRPGRPRVFLVSWNFLTIFHTVERFISRRFAIQTILFPLLWSLITAFRPTVIVKRIFENFGIPSLKLEIVSFQMVIILRKLRTLIGFHRKTKPCCFNSWTPCALFLEIQTSIAPMPANDV